ncbi:hypothetical protein [Chitinolyticbacter meiyuanensis]|uniref:hypothetical protein n=1 Tax=Chitinolyticbacter meiyuanensis TaxID=682798 RepID=UPI0011E5F8FD|nr:hypothetical protein [Chitinolyticbacter meiyuanensis]
MMTATDLSMISISSLAFFIVLWRWSPLEGWPRLVYAQLSPVIFFGVGILLIVALQTYASELLALMWTPKNKIGALVLIPCGLAWWCWKRFCERKLKRCGMY